MHYNLFHCILYCVCYLFSQRFGRLSPGIPDIQNHLAHNRYTRKSYKDNGRIVGTKKR